MAVRLRCAPPLPIDASSQSSNGLIRAASAAEWTGNESGAAIPQAALTSWQALFDHGHLESGQTVVIHGAGGGVGRMGVHLARWAGAHVIGTGRANARQRVLARSAAIIARLVDEGTLRPDVGAVYPLADAREAFMAKSTEHIPGKVRGRACSRASGQSACHFPKCGGCRQRDPSPAAPA